MKDGGLTRCGIDVVTVRTFGWSFVGISKESIYSGANNRELGEPTGRGHDILLTSVEETDPSQGGTIAVNTEMVVASEGVKIRCIRLLILTEKKECLIVDRDFIAGI